MRTTEVVKHFGTKAAIARALGITRQSLSQWSEFPPQLAQYRLEELTNGELKRSKLTKIPKKNERIHR
jgi:DNA-binding transcriptional regulator YdaS (Cro superfamily)